jgi:hypothetical protein
MRYPLEENCIVEYHKNYYSMYVGIVEKISVQNDHVAVYILWAHNDTIVKHRSSEIVVISSPSKLTSLLSMKYPLHYYKKFDNNWIY